MKKSEIGRRLTMKKSEIGSLAEELNTYVSKVVLRKISYGISFRIIHRDLHKLLDECLNTAKNQLSKR